MPHHYASSLLRTLLVGGLTSLLAGPIWAQSGTTVLRAGDLVVTGLNTSTDNDEFTFAPLVDLAAGTQIKFTDNGWLSSGGFRSGEGTATYTAPAPIAKGTLIRYQFGQPSPSPGFSATGGFQLAEAGDQILVYQGATTAPVFLCALTTKGPWSSLNSAATTALPPGLVDGTSAVAEPWANGYMSQTNQRRGTPAQLRTWFNTANSWVGHNTNRQSWASTPPYSQNLQIDEGLVPDADELTALQALYTSTGGPNWTSRTNWPTTLTPWPATLSSVNFATWFGITVVNGDVTAVQLSSNHLVGTLPVELGKLTQLRTLRLHDNALGGGLPDELGQVARLQTLDLSANQFTGDFPPVVVGLRQLQELSLYNNQFSGLLPADLGQCRQLVYLQLSNNRLTGAVPASLGRLARLEALLLDHNQFSDSLPDSLARLSVLNVLLLRNNQFSGPIPVGWQQLTQLTALRLEDNRLTGTVPAGVAALPNLFYLGLARNRLTGTIPPFLGTAPSAVTGFADFSDNDFTGLTPYTGVSNYSTKNLLVAGNRLDFGALPQRALRPTPASPMSLSGRKRPPTRPATCAAARSR